MLLLGGNESFLVASLRLLECLFWDPAQPFRDELEPHWGRLGFLPHESDPP